MRWYILLSASIALILYIVIGGIVYSYIEKANEGQVAIEILQEVQEFMGMSNYSNINIKTKLSSVDIKLFELTNPWFLFKTRFFSHYYSLFLNSKLLRSYIFGNIDYTLRKNTFLIWSILVQI